MTKVKRRYSIINAKIFAVILKIILMVKVTKKSRKCNIYEDYYGKNDGKI